MNEEVEIWKDVKDHEGLYQISNLGRVRGVDRVVPFVGRGGKPTQRFQKGKILKTSVGTSGYETFHLSGHDQERQTVMMHRLVALHFLPQVEGKDFVNHIDGDKLNNRVENLEWVTKSENTLHAIDNGLLKKSGEDCNLSKLTEQQVKEILALRKFGKKHYFAKDIAPRYNISEKYVQELDYNLNKWTRLKAETSDEELKTIFEEVSKTFEKSILVRTPSKHIVSDIEKEAILERRKNGDRVVDIARDFNRTQKFISWFTLKHLKVDLDD